MHGLAVDLGDRSYPILVGPGTRHELARLVPKSAKKAAIVTQQAIADSGWLDGLDPGVEFDTFVMGDGEAHKSMATVETLCRQFAQTGLSRSDVVVALGGGIVTDVAGFAAASY